MASLLQMSPQQITSLMIPTPTKETSKHVYISGPMRGIEDFNFPAFNERAEWLRKLGYEVINPAESFGGRTDLGWHDYMRVDIESLLHVDSVCLLPGWENSVGVKVELTVAAALGLRVWDSETDEDVDVSYLLQPGAGVDDDKAIEQETVLQTANRLVYGNRQRDYGHPLTDMTRTAKLWSVIFGVEIEPIKVPLAMAALKISRELERHKTDNLIDLAGYAAVAARVAGDDD